ncbi:GNAT family N-acetyltransferase [Photobacterium sp. WH24]|uniref:GNAT family N-acetyltransferase n=1 Tax=Photobacterium sp. WH24 TaxID=2827237 RepID=UPI001C448C8A|nr:GNAT family N-acetyltransferase [Photobacterium sp. WH24]MBV7263074.1 GNAT family N-acetyltransferase [Photobacterium sp. WH24]
MQIRQATESEMNSVYMMGYDAWGDEMPQAEYLTACKRSRKYTAGQWYVLPEADMPVASLILYRHQFGLEDGQAGIGSIATSPAHRRQGYASQLILGIVRHLFSSTTTTTVFLHSDIDTTFYEALGFERINSQSDCLFITRSPDITLHTYPSYF